MERKGKIKDLGDRIWLEPCDNVLRSFVLELIFPLCLLHMNLVGFTSCIREGVSYRMRNGIVHIHGKDYMTVAKRVELAHEEKALESVETEVLSHNPVVVKAKIVVKGKVYTGISSVSLESSKLIEKQNPYEVAETSAVGRALGFSGFGLIESIATADEVVAAQDKSEDGQLTCDMCGNPAVEKKGTTKSGKAYHGIFCSTEDKSHTRWLAVN